MLSAFGSLPKGSSLDRVRQSPNYQDGGFRNQLLTTMDMGPAKLYDTFKRMSSTKGKSPDKPLSFLTPDYARLQQAEQGLIWFGHSSYIMRFGGLTWLIDPVFSKRASPVKTGPSAFKGTDFVTVDSLPSVDVLLLTHDHYDHLDFKTVSQLIPRVKHIVCPLGVDAHLLSWGATTSQLTVLDWYQTTLIGQVRLTATPARHFSGRLFKRNQSLWASYVLELPGTDRRVFVGGDSGFGPHFQEIGKRFGSFDLAIMECGQYDVNWSQIHAMPEDSAQGAALVGARVVQPVHWGKFALAIHPWDEPVMRFLEAAKAHPYQVATPMLGQFYDWLGDLPQDHWWEAV